MIKVVQTAVCGNTAKHVCLSWILDTRSSTLAHGLGCLFRSCIGEGMLGVALETGSLVSFAFILALGVVKLSRQVISTYERVWGS